MSDQPEQEPEKTSSTPEELGAEWDAAKIMIDMERNAAQRERLRAEALAADLEVLREALRCVRQVTCEALADAAPKRTMMVVSESGGDLIACFPVSDAVANNYDKKRSIHELSKQLWMSVDFVEVRGKTLTSVEACETVLRHLDRADDDSFTK
jgi:hypothetical protein